MHLRPHQGEHEPWQMLHDYSMEREILPAVDLDDGTLQFK
jgi:hypothetical protein